MEFGPGGPNDDAIPAIVRAERARAKMLAQALTKICEVKEAEPRFFFLTAFCLLKAGEKDAVRPWLERALEHALAEVDDPNVTEARTAARVVAEVGRVAASLGDDGLLERSCRAYLTFVTAGVPIVKGHLQVVDEARSPIVYWARRLIEGGRFVELYRLLTEPGARPFRTIPTVLRKDLAAVTTPEPFTKAVQGECVRPADHLRLAEFLAEYFESDAAAIAHLERVHERFATDPAVHFELARLLARRGEWAKAYAAAKAGFEGTPAGADQERLALLATRLGVLSGQAQMDVSSLRSIERSRDRLSHWAEVFALLGERESAIRLYGEAAGRGERPNMQLGGLYLQSGDLENALRYVNRHRREGSSVRPWPAEEELPQPRDAVSLLSADQARARIFEKLGVDFFIDRWLAAQQERPTAEEEKRAAELLSVLGAGDADQRRKARAELAQMNPRVGPLLKKALDSKDEWVRVVVRGMLGDWAEPR
ncbi:MAG: hypothetical protein HYY16_19425 [Planctomycetes bacterium]|nr:hypothetical protein [Planctomycetota bacterium]